MVAYAEGSKEWSVSDGEDIDYTRLKVGDTLTVLNNTNNNYRITSSTQFYLFYKTSPNAECFFSTDSTDAEGFTRFAAGYNDEKNLYRSAITSAYTIVADNRPVHAHNWKYSVGTGANVNTITAKCDGTRDCTVTNGKIGISLTLTASNANYSGNPISISSLFTGMNFDAFNTATGKSLSVLDIKVHKEGEASQISNITSNGWYVAELTVEFAKATLDFLLAILFQ